MGIETPNLESLDEGEITNDEEKQLQAWRDNAGEGLDLEIDDDNNAEMVIPEEEEGLAQAA